MTEILYDGQKACFSTAISPARHCGKGNAKEYEPADMDEWHPVAEMWKKVDYAT